MTSITSGSGIDITPTVTGFFSIIASGSSPFSIRSYLCGSNTFSDVFKGTFIQLPYYVSSGTCIQLYNPSNSTIDVNYVVGTDSPATTMFTVSTVLWFLLLFFTYIVMAGVGVYGGRIGRSIVRRVQGRRDESPPVLPETVPGTAQIPANMLSTPPVISPPVYEDLSNPALMYISSFNKGDAPQM